MRLVHNRKSLATNDSASERRVNRGLCDLPIDNHDVRQDGRTEARTDIGDAGGAVGASVAANAKLVDESKTHPDSSLNRQRMINVIYTDVVQESRSADVALLRNGLVKPACREPPEDFAADRAGVPPRSRSFE